LIFTPTDKNYKFEIAVSNAKIRALRVSFRDRSFEGPYQPVEVLLLPLSKWRLY